MEAGSSHRVCVCFHPPLHRRAKVNFVSWVHCEGDQVEEALAGEKVQVEVKERPMGRLRGWFPRQCSVEKVEHEDRCMLRQSRTGRRTSR